MYLQGLLSDTDRKNMEAMALGLAGPETVRNLQRLMSEYRWQESWMQRRHWELCAERLSDPRGVWSVDASEMAKKGTESVGVAPQYCGSLGKTANCQSGVFICYASSKGHALLNRQLYLPKCWFEPEWADRRKQCRIPVEVQFPDLVLEITLTSGGVSRLEVYRRFRVPEVWFWRRDAVEIFALLPDGFGYEQVAQSRLLPRLDLALLERCVRIASWREARRAFRAALTGGK